MEGHASELTPHSPQHCQRPTTAEFNPIKKWWNDRKESDIAWKVDIKTIIERKYDLDIKNPTKQEEKNEFNSVELMDLLHFSFNKSNSLLNQLKQELK